MKEINKMELLQAGVAGLYRDKLLCDVQLQVEGKVFPAHKVILASISDHFRSLFTCDFKEISQIVIEGISAAGLEGLLEVVYTAELKLSANNFHEIVPAADMFKIQPVMTKCEQENENIMQTTTNHNYKLGKITEQFLSGIKDLYKKNLLCDVKLEAEGRIFPAHKAILAAVSDYFRAMFTGGFKESDRCDQPVVMKGISATGLEVILGSIYQVEPRVMTDNILETIPVACMLQYQALIEECEDMLIKFIDVKNCFTYMELAERFMLKRALKCFEEFKRSRFSYICQTEKFLELKKADVVKYLSLPDLCLAGKEMIVFSAAVDWLNHRPKQRKRHVLELFRCVNLLHIPLAAIRSVVKKEPIIRDNRKCSALVKEAVKYHKKILTQPFYEGNITNTRGVSDGIIYFQSKEMGKYMFDEEMSPLKYWKLFGGTAPELVFLKYLSIEEKNTHLERYMPMYTSPYDSVTGKLPGQFSHVAKIGNFLFVLAITLEVDSDSSSDSNSDDTTDSDSNSDDTEMDRTWMMLRYDPMLDEWKSLTPPPINLHKSSFCFVQCSEKHLLLFGSKNIGTWESPLDAVFSYIYVISEDKWEEGPLALESTRDGLDEAVYHNGNVFCLDESTIFKFDLNTKSWTEESSLDVPWNINSLSFMESLENSLFLVSDDSSRDDAIAEYSLETKKWTYHPLNLDWGVDSGFSHNRFLYLFSHNQGREEWETELYRFDPNDKTCSYVRDIPYFVAHSTGVPMLLPRL